MKPPSTALLRAFSPLWRIESMAPKWFAKGCLFQGPQQQQQHNAFSSTPSRQKRSKGSKKDMRVTMIRYFLSHGLTPRPLRFSRNRALRHWTIHRAWQMYQSKLRESRQLELERQYNSMTRACEALLHLDDRGLTESDCEKLGAPPPEAKEVGKLYRVAMLKKGIWDQVPMEYARLQTETPSRSGWNAGWTR